MGKLENVKVQFNAAPSWRVLVVAVLLLGATTSAHAQSRGMGGGSGGGRPGRSGGSPSSGQSEPPPSNADLPPPPPAPPSVVWPWIDEGGILCASRDALYKFQTRSPKDATHDEQLECRSVLQKTGIRIIGHDGPSRTQVMTTDATRETGWTNAFLPANPPAR